MQRLEHSLSSFHVIQDVDENRDLEYLEEMQAADFETAIEYARYGKFQRALLAVCGAIYATCAISTTTLSFVLPSAECDFGLSSSDKGKLSATPLIGMIFGCGFWGSIADCHGRRIAIMMALCTDFLAAVSSSVAGNFEMFLVCRFFNGFGIIGATSIIFSYLGEFLAKRHRDVMLGRLEIFWTIGNILLPGVAWPFLSESVHSYFQYHPSFSPWRTFVLICSLPSLVSLVCLYFLPETPKFLLSKGRFDLARDVFKGMFSMNTGYPAALYPLLTFDGEMMMTSIGKREDVAPATSKVLVKVKRLYDLLKTFCSRPYLKFVAIAGFADFGLMASYYTLIMWFPEIFERFRMSSGAGLAAGVCTVSQGQGRSVATPSTVPCDSAIGDRVFGYTAIIALSCVPTATMLSMLMRRLSKKIVLVGGLILAGFSTFSLSLVRGSIQTIALSCVFEALTSVLEAVLFCVVVDLFPTNLRAVAIALTATSGRLGAIFGNILFGILVDVNCVAPIYTFGFLLIGSGLLCLLIPGRENYTQID